jgi:hypothetical protein
LWGGGRAPTIELMQLSQPPDLTQPTAAVRDSWLAAERADCARQGTSTELLDRAR